MNKIDEVIDRFKKDMKSLALDERDAYPDVEEIKKQLIDSDVSEEANDIYEQMKNIVSAAEQVAYNYRVGNKINIAEAETEFYQLMGGL